MLVYNIRICINLAYKFYINNRFCTDGVLPWNFFTTSRKADHYQLVNRRVNAGIRAC